MHTLSTNLLRQLQRGEDEDVVSLLEAVQAHGSAPGEAVPSHVPWERACEMLAPLIGRSDPSLMLNAGRQMSVRAFSMLGALIAAAPTTRAVLHAADRFSPLVLSGTRFILREDGNRATVVFRLPPCPENVATAVTEFVLAFSHRAGDLCPPGTPGVQGASVRHARPPHAALYESHFEFPVEFDQPENSFWFAAGDLDLALPGGDLALFTALCAHAEQAVAGDAQASWALRAKAELRATKLGQLGLQGLSSKLGVGASTLQRRLKQEGTSVSALLDEARCEVALATMGRPDAEPKRLAEELGFSEPSAFYRAFRRWTGHTPRAYRAARGLS